jgi:exodeoxyribonuclease V alpha subunit
MPPAAASPSLDASLPSRLANAVAAGRLRPLDVRFGEAVARWSALTGEARACVRLAATLACAGLAEQHACIDVGTALAADPLGDAGPYPPPGAVEQALLDSGVASDGATASGRRAPLVLDAHRLYVARYHDYESRLAAMVAARARRVDPVALPAARARLAQYFPPAAGGTAGEIDWQRVAAAMALTRPLTIVTGGPGTGKTTTVTSVLALLVEAGFEPRRIRLAAPTGKAARRLAESLAASKERLRGIGAEPRVLAAIPDQAVTLHRLLCYSPRDNAFEHTEANPLPVDVVVVDEASMMDLRLAHALFAALPPAARVILLGDKDQLYSVATGMVLGDLCAGLAAHFEQARFSRDSAQRLAALTGDDFGALVGDDVPPLADCLCWLRVSHRFQRRGGIGRLAAGVNAGHIDEVLAAFAAGSGVKLERADAVRAVDGIAGAFVPLLAAARRGAGPAEVLAALGRFQVLCALRDGPFGVAGLNHAIERALVAGGHADGGSVRYPGQPILVDANDYRLGLFNGDVGVVVATAHGLRVAFPAEDGVRLFAPARLPPHGVAYAITIHKSQGSEFDAVAVVLPPDPRAGERRLLTRELLYTALTRARERVTVFANRRELRLAVTTPTLRASGLRDRLWA